MSEDLERSQDASRNEYGKSAEELADAISKVIPWGQDAGLRC